jgi:cysteinyl-tRNA synthetase
VGWAQLRPPGPVAKGAGGSLSVTLAGVRRIRLHDTLSGGLRELEPRAPGRVGIYACGPTVYGRVHIGNARPFVVFALLKRFLEREGLEVTLVENVTDVNDKIYAAAAAAGIASGALAAEMIAHYERDTDRLGLGRPDHEPRAVQTIGPIMDLISELIDRGHAYAVEGDVYFRVASFPGYGRLSNRPVQEMEQGEGDDATARKESPRDFALWKAHKAGEDTAWAAPWGRGRPGWHIECSAMAEQLLGTDFEIHGGGSDLVFPHHENEIAQTEAARGAPLARIWMHNGMVRTGEAKIAKSAGEIHLLHRALDEHGREALLLYLTSGHYRQPLAFSARALAEAGRSVRRLRELCRRLDPTMQEPVGPVERVERAERFFDALAEDFNTPAALAALFEWVREANRRLDGGEALGPGPLAGMLHALGLESLLEEAGLPEGLGSGRHAGGGGAEGGDAGPALDAELESLLAEREEARGKRDFERADRLRDELAARGFAVRDTPAGARLVPLR